MAKRSTFSVILAIVLCIATISLTYADTVIYRWIDKDGVASFSQSKPTERGVHDVTSFTVESLPVSKQRAVKRAEVNLGSRDEPGFEKYEKQLKQADRRIDVAMQRLKVAEQNLTDGSIPTGFDRIGNVGGHARMRESYFERVAKLQYEVDQAHDELNKAFKERNLSFSGSK